MHSRGFDFIHLDPFGCATHYFDSCFKNIRNGGIVVITSTDTGSLFGKVPSVAKRNYDAYVMKTEYFREEAARLVLGAAARAAGRCNKGLLVLYTVAMEHFVQVVVKIQRGANHADASINKVSKVLHCLVCEERAVVNNSNHPVDAVTNDLLSCTCLQQGKNRILLGPLWCGSIFDINFLVKMNDVSEKVAICMKTKEILSLLISEAICSKDPTKERAVVNNSNHPPKLDSKRLKPQNEEQLPRIEKSDETGKKRSASESNDAVLAEISCKKQKSPTVITDYEEPETTPMFYYSSHQHIPKGLELIKMPRLVEILQKEGFRASRTHFESMAIRTNATATDLRNVLSKHCTPIPSNKK
jgi:tRNA G26 N,N-dimethylase Trm1